ncbi:MAG TPA: tetratricopeptide repeat protein [Longimicrobium sp.]|nr:tetratricopeptide repeat protein [Longimicrobium sp.]
MSSTARIGAASRRQRVPPALTRGPDRLDGIAILDELKGDLGLVLWRSARNVRLWAETPLDRRGELFAGGAALTRRQEVERLELDAELLAPMSVIVSLLEAPGRAEVQRLVNACRRIALWAEQRGALGTALEFSLAAAQAAPESAALAYEVAGLARRSAQYDRAESWYSRAIVQGRQNEQWRAYALALIGMGNMAIRRGNFPAARRTHRKSLRAARRHGVREAEAMAYHDLFVIEIETGAGAGSDADTYAAAAFAAYDPRSPRLARLGYDVAYNWTLHGYFARALPVAQALTPHFDAPVDLIMVHGLVARAAGGTGAEDTHAEAARRVRSLIEAEGAEEGAARALLGVAYGAANLRNYEEAQAAALQALEIAMERKEGRVIVAAEAALESIRSGARVREAAEAPKQPVADELAAGFVRVLSRPAVAAA